MGAQLLGTIVFVAVFFSSQRISSGQDRAAPGSAERPAFRGHTGPIHSVAYSPDGQRIISGSADMTIKVWDAQTGQETITLKGHTRGVSSVAFSPDAKRIVSGSHDGTVRLWDAQSGQEALTLVPLTVAAVDENFRRGAVSSVAYSPDGRRIVSGAGAFQTLGDLTVWDAQTGERVLQLQTGPVYSVAYSPDGKRIASGSGSTLRVWDAQTGQNALNLGGHTGPVHTVAFSPNGKRIVSGGYDADPKLWDAQTAQQIPIARLYTWRNESAAYSPDGMRIVYTSSDNTFAVSDVTVLEAQPGQKEEADARWNRERNMHPRHRAFQHLVEGDPVAWAIIVGIPIALFLAIAIRKVFKGRKQDRT